MSLFFSKKYWVTQFILKKKWVLDQWPYGKTENFQRFLIICDPRTGSTWLHTLLNSHPRIMSFGEILSEKKDLASLEKVIWNKHHMSIKAVGAKIFYEQLCDEKFNLILDEIRNKHEVKVIDLSRRDVTASYHSLKLARASGQWSLARVEQGNDESVDFDQNELALYQIELEKNRSRILRLLDGHDKLSIVYEELLSEEHSTLNRIQKFLGLEPTDLFSLLQKQSK